MKLTRVQKIRIAVFIVSLLPAYWIANWRFNSKLTTIHEMFEKQQALHQSSDKLLVNCEKIAATNVNPYDATHQICAQGSRIHEHTKLAMGLLTQEKASNETNWYRDFALTSLMINLLAFVLYRMRVFLKREAD